MPESITPVILPPYSPELNPAENVWEYLRKNKLANRLYETYEDIVEACCDAWNSLMAMPAASHPLPQEPGTARPGTYPAALSPCRGKSGQKSITTVQHEGALQPVRLAI